MCRRSPDPRRNPGFCTRGLGPRLIKNNLNGPSTCYGYGSETGQPGTILPLLPREHVAPN